MNFSEKQEFINVLTDMVKRNMCMEKMKKKI